MATPITSTPQTQAATGQVSSTSTKSNGVSVNHKAIINESLNIFVATFAATFVAGGSQLNKATLIGALAAALAALYRYGVALNILG